MVLCEPEALKNESRLKDMELRPESTIHLNTMRLKDEQMRFNEIHAQSPNSSCDFCKDGGRDWRS
jgi:hypothetical protein